ncbi:hypothetical protein TNCT_715911 [Trichonephila clavata]|uniref:Uncharacterized protein n=1 Tax=Trichonephila clavata TaxID=2740835 RepID=A0A8X6L133_TRICU|nr:hypothetical protein TNCT_715911 [Trichonephila clavata]
MKNTDQCHAKREGGLPKKDAVSFSSFVISKSCSDNGTLEVKKNKNQRKKFRRVRREKQKKEKVLFAEKESRLFDVTSGGRGSAVWKRSLRQDETSQSNTSQHHGRGNGAEPPVGARAALSGRTPVGGAARDGRGVGGCPSAQRRVSDHSLIGSGPTFFLLAVSQTALVSSTCY